jgi:hypothetical protein
MAVLPQLRNFHIVVLIMAVLALGPGSSRPSADAGATSGGHRQPQHEVNPAEA